ncbi:MAG: phosphoribosylformylglycinamidine cyclo-ligase [Planctomycetota bacterium]|jgi:phosphoribosylformylglycinamidine cyclo-ligase
MAEQKRKLTYKDAGVDIDLKTEALRNVKRMVSKTFTPQVLSGIGNFGTLFDISKLGFESPVLVASTDGVGTKLKIAVMTGRHDTVGMDLVNHCTNDILVQGAAPLFFLDYIASGRFDPDIFQQLVKGLAEACKDNGIALVGGETAEMPGFYGEEEYDLVGFILGAVDRNKLVDGSGIRSGDHLLGLESSGLHTNGYSLVRKILFDMEGFDLADQPEDLERPLGEELLMPHRSYLKAARAVEAVTEIKGMAHITGGGITDNLPRILPEGLAARVRYGSWPILPIFRLIVGLGGLSSHESLKVFNMGVGFIIVVAPEGSDAAREALDEAGYRSHVIGEVVQGESEVIYEKL